MISREHPCTSIITSESEFDLYCSSIPIKNPKISVIVSTYNRLRREGDCDSLLKRALDSILNQTFTNFELILIDDCSSDNTKDYCKEIVGRDPRVKFFHFKKNSGLPAKRYNFGISVSCGKYLTFMFDDDQLELNALEDLYQAIEGRYKNCGMVYGLATIYCGSDRDNPDILGEKWSWNKIHFHNFISNNSVILKRSVIDIVGGYDENPIISRVCDWDLWWRIGRKFQVGRIQSKIGIVYSQLPDSIGLTRVLDWDVCKKHQRNYRTLPLVCQKEPLSCKIHAACFDLYVGTYLSLVKIWRKIGFKRRLKKILPENVYQFLKNSKAFFAK